MKKILFFLIDMNLGGTEKSFLNLIETIPKDYKIDLLLLRSEGALLDQIPERVNILNDLEKINGYKLSQQTPLSQIKSYVGSGKILAAFSGLWHYLMFKITQNGVHNLKIIDGLLPDLNKEYDVAVAYAGPHHLISYYVSQKIKAKKKIQWIHFDVKKINFDIKTNSRLYKNFNEIKTVTNASKENLIQMIPEIKDKTQVFYNLINKNQILNLSLKQSNPYPDGFDGIRILTVGRLTKEKGHRLAINAIKMLYDDGFNIRYYIIGSGSEETELKQQVKDLHLTNIVRFLGLKSNPYPFMKDATIYVQPSLHEGYGITVAEAKLFCNPIVVTNFASAKDLIENEKTGLIVNIDKESIYKGIKRLIQDESLQKTISENLRIENTIEKSQPLPF